MGDAVATFGGGALVVAGPLHGFHNCLRHHPPWRPPDAGWPYYTAEGIGTAMTAFISLASAVIFWLLMPQLAAIPSPAAAEAMNLRLLDEARRREEADRSAR